jgi:Domain of unknown function (DUF4424)
MAKYLLALMFLAAGCFPARANDSTAELATGGLKFVTTPDIEMQSENLHISPREIKVRYGFFNTSTKPVTTLVAFPMPDIVVNGPDDNVAYPTDDPENILGFHTTVAGKPVVAKLEQKVFAAGVDRTDLLRRLGIPLAPQAPATNEALDKLPPAKWGELIKLGLADVDEYDDGHGMQKHLEARWTLKSTYYWEQTFPPRAELVIEHSYQPSVGASVMTSLGQDWARKNGRYPDYETKYCTDRDFVSTVEGATKAAAKTQSIAYTEQRIDYVLSTGANWDGPIKDFRLVVDKDNPTNLVSFCGEGVKKISPTQFEMRKTDFTPTEDLNVLILAKPAR